MANAAAAIIGQAAEAETLCPAGPGAVPLTIAVNGTVHTLQIEPGMTLAEVLRGPLGRSTPHGQRSDDDDQT